MLEQITKTQKKCLLYEGKRRCWKCKNIFPLTTEYFPRNSSNPNGHGFPYICRTCKSSEERRWRKENPERYRELHKKHREAGKFSVKTLYCAYRTNAKRRKKPFEISLEEFGTFWQKPCYFCGGEVKTIGIDRLDSSLGYSSGNLVSCCRVCNMMKGYFPKDTFLTQCVKIIKHLDLK